MRLHTWLKKDEANTQVSLMHKTGLSQRTIARVAAADHARRTSTALLICEATGGEVTLEDLCSPPPDAKAKRAKPKHPRRGRPERVTTQRGHR